jgi:sulfur carrier protein
MGSVKVEIHGKVKTVEVGEKGIRVSKLLKLLDIYPETAVVLKNGELVCEDEILKDEDEVKVIVAISRG